MKDPQKSLYKVNSAPSAGKGNAQGMLTFPSVGQGMFTFSLAGPAQAPRFYTLFPSADAGHNILV